MLIDGITLIDEAQINREYTDPAKIGEAFPADPSNGQVFQLTLAVGDKQPGIYAWSETAGDWVEQTIVEENPYDIGLNASGKPRPSVVVTRVVAVRSFLIAEGFAESISIAQDAATAEAVFTIGLQNVDTETEIELGTLTYPAGEMKGSFSQTGIGDMLVQPGEILFVKSGEVQDTTLRDLVMTISARLVVAGS